MKHHVYIMWNTQGKKFVIEHSHDFIPAIMGISLVSLIRSTYLAPLALGEKLCSTLKVMKLTLVILGDVREGKKWEPGR